MNSAFTKMQRIGAVAAMLAAGALWAGAAPGADGQDANAQPPADKSLAEQIFDTIDSTARNQSGLSCCSRERGRMPGDVRALETGSDALQSSSFPGSLGAHNRALLGRGT